MRSTVYLIMTSNGVVATRKTTPELKRGEVAVKLRINVPDKFFWQPIPEIEITVPEALVIKPEVGIEVVE